MTGAPDDPRFGPVPEGDEALALDWALGALEAGDRAAAEARRRSDPAFAALCDAWAERLAPLADAVPPRVPPAGLFARIEAEIDPARPADSGLAGQVAALRRKLALWRAAAVAGLAAAAAAGLLALQAPRVQIVERVVERQVERPAGALLAATLAGEGQGALVTASLDVQRSAVVLSPVADARAGDRVTELWLIPADGKPRSLGVVDLGGARRVAVPPTVLKLVAEGAVLAVSLEPVGGSPTGSPTGPVVATGKLTRV